jgi:hypothetical protein
MRPRACCARLTNCAARCGVARARRAALDSNLGRLGLDGLEQAELLL